MTTTKENKPIKPPKILDQINQLLEDLFLDITPNTHKWSPKKVKNEL